MFMNGPCYYLRMKYAKTFNTTCIHFPLSICITTVACEWNADLCLSLCASSGLNLLHSTLSQSIEVVGDWVRDVCSEVGHVHACLGGGGGPLHAYMHMYTFAHWFNFLNGCATAL